MSRPRARARRFVRPITWRGTPPLVAKLTEKSITSAARRGERTVAARVEASGAREGDEKIARDVVGGGVEGAEGGF